MKWRYSNIDYRYQVCKQILYNAHLCLSLANIITKVKGIEFMGNIQLLQKLECIKHWHNFTNRTFNVELFADFCLNTILLVNFKSNIFLIDFNWFLHCLSQTALVNCTSISSLLLKKIMLMGEIYHAQYHILLLRCALYIIKVLLVLTEQTKNTVTKKFICQ